MAELIGAPGALDLTVEEFNEETPGHYSVFNAIWQQLLNNLAELNAIKASLASPALTGTPTAPTAAPGANGAQIANAAFVQAALAALVDASPTTLDTLNELAAALGDDPNFATTMTNALAGKAPINDYVRQPGYAVTAGAANAYTVATVPAPAAYVDGMGLVIRVHAANTGASTVKWGALAAVAIVDSKGNAIAAGKLPLGGRISLRYSTAAGNFQLQGEGGDYGTAVAADVLAPKTIGTDAGIVAGTMPDKKNQTVYGGAEGVVSLGVYAINTAYGQLFTKPSPNNAASKGYMDSTTQLEHHILGLLPQNIKKDTNIAGMVGTYKGDNELLVDMAYPGLSMDPASGIYSNFVIPMKLGNYILAVVCAGSGGNAAYNLTDGTIQRLMYGGSNANTWAACPWEAQGLAIRHFLSTVGTPFNHSFATHDPVTNISTNRIAGGPEGANAAYSNPSICVDEATSQLFVAVNSISPTGNNSYGASNQINVVTMSKTGAWGAWAAWVDTGLGGSKLCMASEGAYIYFMYHNYPTDSNLYIYRVQKSNGVLTLLRTFTNGFSGSVFNNSGSVRQQRELTYVHLGNGDYLVAAGASGSSIGGIQKFSAATGAITTVTNKGNIGYTFGGIFRDVAGNKYQYGQCVGTNGSGALEYTGRTWKFNGAF